MAVIIGIGLDVVDVERFGQTMDRRGERLLAKLFTPAEVGYCLARVRKHEHLAARFAAKEAALKALGTGAGKNAHFREVEVLRTRRGKPVLQLHGRTARLAGRLGVTNIHVSLTHTEALAAAQVVMEGS